MGRDLQVQAGLSEEDKPMGQNNNYTPGALINSVSANPSGGNAMVIPVEIQLTIFRLR